jgi:succinate dehydrogenase hydrophobic anchor subunit
MGTTHLGQLTPRRKLALALALLWLVVFVAFVLVTALHSTPSAWHPIYLLPIGGINAFALGIMVFELACWVAPGVGRRVEGKYCFSVQVLTGVFLVLQIAAYLTLSG